MTPRDSLDFSMFDQFVKDSIVCRNEEFCHLVFEFKGGGRFKVLAKHFSFFF